MTDYKEGDVVFWRYKEDQGDGAGTRYWCKSQYAIFREVKDGRFVDTYWTGGDRFFFKANDPQIEVTYMGNLNDYKPCGEEVFLYYDKKDILDIRHPNDSRALFVREGAVKSTAAIYNAINVKIDKFERDIDYNLREKKRLQDILSNLDEGGKLEGFWI